MLEAFDDRAGRSRDRILVLSTTRRATVGDIDDWSRLVAERIAAAHLAPGNLVGLSAPSGPAFLAGLLAVRRARCTALLLDDGAPAADRDRVLSAVGAHAVLGCRMDSGWTALDARVDLKACVMDTAPPTDRAVIKMTSGSTGTPRGVAVSTEALLADESSLAETMGLRPDDRLVAAVPMSHSYGFTTLALSSLVRGLQLVMPDDAGPLAPLAAAGECEATVFPTAPAYLHAVLRMSQPPVWPAGIRLVITAGAPLPPATAAQFRGVTGRPVHVFYGSSECGGISYDRTGDAGERGTVGTPVSGVSIVLAAADDAPPDAGLVTVTSAAVGETYVPQPDRRLAHGRFETADLAMWKDGEIALLRRADRALNIRGFKVDPSEVERVLATLPGVEDVVVTGTPGPDGVGTMLRAVVACSPGRLDAVAVAAWCRPRLAEHKVPRSIVLVDALPRTSRGKIDRVALDGLRADGGRPVPDHA